jgi:VanZ family protein
MLRTSFALRNPAAPVFLCAVPKLKSFAKYWLPVLIWMVVIYSASGDRKSVHHSSRIIEPIVRWLLPGISDAALWDVVYYVRKTAHVTEYAILAILLWRAMPKPTAEKPRPWPWKVAGLVLLAAFVYAASDEIHQAFVPNREGRAMDVLIDTSGAALGLAAVWLFGRCRHRW